MTMNFSPVRFNLIGGPTVLLEYEGLRLLTDPTFDACGCVYERGGVTLRKTADPVCAVADLMPLDAVLLSHDQHADNLDDAGRALLQRVPLVLTTPVGAGRLGGAARGLAPWQSTTLTTPDGRTVRVTGTPCRHGPAGIEPLAGDVTGFMLESVTGTAPTVYVTGDTVYYEGVGEVARRFSPEVIVAFAGAARPRGPFDVTMSVNDLLDTAHAFPRALILPVHSEGWAHFTLSTDEVSAVFDKFSLAERIATLRRGRAFVFPRIAATATEVEAVHLEV
jgi:L-ascorbate metabolism protein UlaG (beta-lactamase superfamily)